MQVTKGDGTISINGGPDIPMEAVRRGLKIIKERGTAGVAGQGDIEEALGGRLRVNEEKNEEATGLAADRLRSLIERIERLDGERKALGTDIADIYLETRGAGFDVKVVRQLVMIRRKEPAEVEEQETLLDLYRHALGM